MAQYLVVGIAVGALLPFAVSVCVFSTTYQGLLSPAPTQGFWSGAATPAPTAIPNPVVVQTGSALRSGGGWLFLVGSIVAALVGEALALRGFRLIWENMRAGMLAAVAGSVVFIAVALCGFLK